MCMSECVFAWVSEWVGAWVSEWVSECACMDVNKWYACFCLDIYTFFCMNMDRTIVMHFSSRLPNVL